jgi:hypothetical protein
VTPHPHRRPHGRHPSPRTMQQHEHLRDIAHASHHPASRTPRSHYGPGRVASAPRGAKPHARPRCCSEAAPIARTIRRRLSQVAKR